MKKNFNKSGRFIRVILGLILIVISIITISQDEFMDNLMMGLGAFLLLTAAINFCPLFYFLGIDTSKPKDKMKMY